jgi:hypothetical protein
MDPLSQKLIYRCSQYFGSSLSILITLPRLVHLAGQLKGSPNSLQVSCRGFRRFQFVEDVSIPRAFDGFRSQDQENSGF